MAVRERIKMENKQYRVPLSKLNEHIRSHIPPERQEEEVEVYYSYVFVKPKIQARKKRKYQVKHPQLKAFLKKMEESGGLRPEDVEIMEKSSKEFRENFDL